jgi:probable rRNA maturation factor
MIITTNVTQSRASNKLTRKLLKYTLKAVGAKLNKVSVDISFVSQDEIKKLNNDFRGVNKVTDVLSFPTLNIKPYQRLVLKDFPNDINPETKHLHLGDIIICEDVARAQAQEYGHAFEREVYYLLEHGYLHLLGFDHMEETDKVLMRFVEEKVLSKFKIYRREIVDVKEN